MKFKMFTYVVICVVHLHLIYIISNWIQQSLLNLTSNELSLKILTVLLCKKFASQFMFAQFWLVEINIISTEHFDSKVVKQTGHIYSYWLKRTLSAMCLRNIIVAFVSFCQIIWIWLQIKTKLRWFDARGQCRYLIQNMIFFQWKKNPNSNFFRANKISGNYLLNFI